MDQSGQEGRAEIVEFRNNMFMEQIKGQQGSLPPTACQAGDDQFTLFGKGYWSEKAKKFVPSTRPQKDVDVEWVYRYITSERARVQTEELRSMMATATEPALRDFKLREFDAVAAAGMFSRGCADGLLRRSPYAVLDFDDLSSTEEARRIQQQLSQDANVATALCFVSPKGRGVKWWVELPAWCADFDFAEQYATLSRYVGFYYGIEADPTGSNVNRLCFLPYDPQCFVNPKFLISK